MWFMNDHIINFEPSFLFLFFLNECGAFSIFIFFKLPFFTKDLLINEKSSHCRKLKYFL
uniref:Uncharacterized protein n=1 Tax=Lepeophtheirus salmonis TaxID=72036 RepID=A0A0K2UWL9_LEPSM